MKGKQPPPLSSAAAGAPRPQISVGEGVALVSALVWPTAVLHMPAVVAMRSREDAWLAMLAAGLVVVPVGLLLGAVSARLPGLGLVDQARVTMGPWLGSAVGAIFLLGTGVLAVYAVRAGTDMLGMLMLPRTPPVVVAAVIVAQGAVGAYYGLEVLARAAVLASLGVAVGVLAVAPGFLPLFDSRYLFPVLARGPGSVLSGAAVAAGFWGQFIVGATYAHAFPAPARLRATALAGGAVAVLPVWLLFALGQGTAGWYAVSRLTFPTVELVRSVRMFRPLLERIEVLVVGTWMALGLVSVALLLWACAWGTARVLGRVDGRPWLPFWTAAVALGALLLPPNLSALVFTWTGSIVPAVVGILAGVVTLVWLAAATRRLALRRTAR